MTVSQRGRERDNPEKESLSESSERSIKTGGRDERDAAKDTDRNSNSEVVGC